MIFATTNAIQDILAEKKTQTRRLVKEGDIRMPIEGEKINCVGILNKNDPTKIILKWVVGKTYAVQSGRGKPCAWYCPKCKAIINKLPKEFKEFKNKDKALQCSFCCYHGIMKPLRIRITSIRKEKLKEISLLDAKAEGFKDIAEFISIFKKINPKSSVEDEVWAICFKVN